MCRNSQKISHLSQKHQVQFLWVLSVIRELQTPTKLYKKESARLDKISDLQGVLKNLRNETKKKQGFEKKRSEKNSKYKKRNEKI
jgi:hypothetical protein